MVWLGIKSQLGDMGSAQVIPFGACFLFFNRFFVIWAFSSFIFHYVSATIMEQLSNLAVSRTYQTLLVL